MRISTIHIGVLPLLFAHTLPYFNNLIYYSLQHLFWVLFDPARVGLAIATMTQAIFLRLALFVGFLWVLCLPGFAQNAVISCPQASPAAPVLTGISELESVLQKEGWSVTRRLGPPEATAEAVSLEIIVSTYNPNDAQQPDMAALRDVVSTQPESLAVLFFSRDNSHRVYAVGSDPVGAMYAAFEVARQIEWGPRETPVPQRIVQTKNQPSLSVRGVRVMLHEKAMQDRLSWFHSQSFWEGFLTTLAKSRFNFLDLHGIYDLSTGRYSNLFSNLYPQIISGENSGDAKAAANNIASLRLIIDMAHDRGISVNLQNAWAPAADQLSQTPQAEAEATTLDLVLTALLKDLPALDGVGMKMAESSQPPVSFLDSFNPVKNHSRQPLLFIEPGTAPTEQTREFLNAYTGRSVMEVEFNGEHLVRPYPVTGSRTPEWNRHSYRSFFGQPRNYAILFQIQSGGTHRIFPWGHVDFIRRTLQSAADFAANGIIVDTYSTFASYADAFSSNTDMNLGYYEWTFERDWFWFLFWGRMAYNRQETTDVFMQAFTHRFGAEAGPMMFQALQKASAAIPAIGSVAVRGPQMNLSAPELDPPYALQELLETQPFDPFAIRSVQEEVECLKSGIPNGKQSPSAILEAAQTQAEEAAALVEQAGEAVRRNVQAGDSLLNEAAARTYREWQSWSLDFSAIAAITRSWRHQMNAAVGLGLYLVTGDVPSLLFASESVEQSRSAWNEAAQFTSTHYRPILQPTQDGARLYHWSSAATPWDNDLQVLTHAYNEWNGRTEWKYEDGHLPVHNAPPGQELILSLSIPPSIVTGSLFARYQNSYGQTGQTKLDKSQVDGVWVAVIPSSVMQEGVLQYYFMGNIAEQMIEILTPNSSKPFIAAITADQDAPRAVKLEHTIGREQNAVTVFASLQDESEAYAVNLYWKPMAAEQPWNKVPMQQSGWEFRAEFPLTVEGAQYYVEAVDNLGNGRTLPDPESDMAYRVVGALMSD